MAEHKTPLLDQLESGPWPSFVKEIKKAAAKKDSAKDLLGVLERSYVEKITHWKHGGIVGVTGYGGGVIGRYVDIPAEFPGVEHFHTIRVNQPAGWYYTTKMLRHICDVWDQYGSGLTNLHGSTGDIVLLGTRTEHLETVFQALAREGIDLGGSGSDLRTPSCCAGPARCEWACIDSTHICHDFTIEFQDELHRPAFPYKFKLKVAGCPMDCVAAVARSDMAIIGTWRDAMRIDQDEVRAYAAGKYPAQGGAGGPDEKVDIQKDVVDLCPTKCMSWDGTNLTVDNDNCVRCMHCIRVMPRALRPGTDTGATILMGGKAPIVTGALLSWVIIPFTKLEPPYEELKDLLRTAWEWWDEHGKMRERIGELIDRLGMRTFLKVVGLPPVPQMVKAPRTNPYMFFWDEELK